MSSQIATFATIFFSMILVNNYVLVQFLGICPFLGVSKKLDSSVGMGMAVIAVMVIATAVTFPLQIFLLDAFNLGYMQTIIFILVIPGFNFLCLQSNIFQKPQKPLKGKIVGSSSIDKLFYICNLLGTVFPFHCFMKFQDTTFLYKKIYKVSQVFVPRFRCFFHGIFRLKKTSHI